MNKERHEKQQVQLKKAALKKASVFFECFETTAGKAVIESLDATYCKQAIFNTDALVMARNAAFYDLVTEIKTMIDMVKNNDRTE